jgi:hypothetical protein
MAFQKQYSDNLQNICSFAFTSNHLINFQLVRSIPNQNIQQNSNKPEFFSFITIAPGEGTNENRTYNFQNKTTVKFSLQEICGMSFVLKSWANSGGKNALPYTKFARSGQGTKTVSIWEPQQQSSGNNQKSRMISITVKDNNNNNGLTVSLTPDQAFAVSESIYELFKKGLNMEFERQINSPKISQSRGNSNNTYNNLNQTNNSSFSQNIDNNPFDNNNDFQQVNDEFENMLLRN